MHSRWSPAVLRTFNTHNKCTGVCRTVGGIPVGIIHNNQRPREGAIDDSVTGPAPQAERPPDGGVHSIFGGTTEIQKEIIARNLGL